MLEDLLKQTLENNQEGKVFIMLKHADGFNKTKLFYDNAVCIRYNPA